MRPLVLAAIALGGAVSAEAQGIFDPWGAKEYVFFGKHDLVVATVVASDDWFATRGDPPRVRLRVTDCLIGTFAPRVVNAVWAAQPMYLLCGTGEEDHVARWESTPLKGPRVGETWIVSGSFDQDSVWEVDEPGRTLYSDSLRSEWIRSIPFWRERAEARQEQIEEARREEQRQSREEAAKVDSAQTRAEKAWFSRERTHAAAVDVDLLVRTASVVLVGEIMPPEPMLPEPVGRNAGLRVIQTLKSDSGTVAPGRRLRLWFGAPEDSLFAHWAKPPSDEIPGTSRGRAVKCIAFLRLAHGFIRYQNEHISYRPADPVDGLLFADSALLERTRIAVNRNRHRPLARRSECGAGIHDFLGLDDSVLTTVRVKITSVGVMHVPWQGVPLTLGCGAQDPGSAGFVPCALADDHYPMDYIGTGWTISLTKAAVRRLLAGLTDIPSVRAGRVVQSDSIAIALRGVIGGRERFGEATITGADYFAFTRLLETLETSDPNARTQIHMWPINFNMGNWVGRSR